MGDYKWSRLTDRLLPWWLRTDEGGLVKRTVDRVLGAFTERARQGLLAHGPETCPADALPYFGRDRLIVRGINEPAAAYGARLVRFLDDHRVRGNPFALHDQLRAYLQADVMIRTVDRRGNWFTTAPGGARSVVAAAGNWSWDTTAATQWARFWVIIYPTIAGAPWSASSGGAPASWPSGGTIGTSATPDQVASVRSIVRDWKPAGTRCEWIIVAFDPGSFNPTAPEPDGTWRNYGYDTAGAYHAVRLNTARYWRGMNGQ